jgi:hypothetical protein
MAWSSMAKHTTCRLSGHTWKLRNIERKDYKTIEL